MKPARLALAIVAAVLALAAPAAAQTDSANAARWLRGVCPGTREVRIATKDGGRVRGYCGPIESAQLRVTLGRGEQVVPFAAVDSIWVLRRGSGRGAETGALIGALVVGGAGALISRGLCETRNPCLDGALLLGVSGAAAGGVAGAIIGGIAGRTTQAWRRIYPD